MFLYTHSFAKHMYLTYSEHYLKILWRMTSSWLLGNALAMSSLVLFRCLRCYRRGHKLHNWCVA